MSELTRDMAVGNSHRRIQVACAAIVDLHTILGRRPTVDLVAPIVQEYENLPGNGAGGSLHIVLDDGNVETDHVRYCRDYALEHGDPTGAALAEVLLLMTKTQRSKM